MKKVSNILLIINFKKQVEASFIQRLSDIIISKGSRVSIFPYDEERFNDMRITPRPSIIKNDDELRKADMAIVLGGDGSIIRASSKVSAIDIPILGINFGTLGYMAELEAREVDRIGNILDGQYNIEKRMMLSVEIIREGAIAYGAHNVLNDVVLSNGPVAKLLNFEATVNGALMQKYRADGIVAATPTGSTAYSLSAGGPIMDPCLDAVCVTPICSHSLSDRPVILPSNAVIGIENIDTEDDSVYATIDGRHVERLEPDDRIRIFRSDFCAKLVRTKTNSFISVLNSKL